MKKKKKLIENPGLKIVSLALAFLAWLAITNTNDPNKTVTISDIPVNVVNASYIEGMGQSYRISDNYDTISVRIRGTRSTVDRLSASNITATADLTQIISLESNPVMVPLSVTVPGISPENVTASPRNISIELEEMVSNEFVVTATTGKSRPAGGYQVGKLEVNPETLTIRGPGSLVNIIERVTANVDVSLLRKDADLIPQIKIYDKNGNEFTEAQMSYLTLNVDAKDILVHVTLYGVVSGVTIRAEASGEPAAGYQVGNVSITPSTISVVGSKEALEKLTENGNVITISSDSGVVDITDASSDQEVRVNINAQLPEGLSLAEDVSSMALVNVQILPFGSKSISVPTKNIRTEGLEEHMNCVFGVNRLEVKVQGSDEALANLKAEDIQMTVNVSGLPAGSHTLPIAFTLPEGCVLVEDVHVDAVLSVPETNQ